jgi:hypothetical protein
MNEHWKVEIVRQIYAFFRRHSLQHKQWCNILFSSSCGQMYAGRPSCPDVIQASIVTNTKNASQASPAPEISATSSTLKELSGDVQGLSWGWQAV